MSHLTEGSVLDVLCPMHLTINHSGHITHAGPTLRKLRPNMTFEGERFLERFVLKRPRAVSSIADLRKVAGVKLHLQLRDSPMTELKGTMVDDGQGGLIVNLSFGISILDGVRDYELTNSDFAATDLAIEMLYLVEAKSAAMEASRKLNLRLQGAMIAAEEQAFTDTLTGLKNRRAMDHVLGRLVQSEVGFALMQIDLDFFKAVNDTMGHAAGDHVLQTVARIMVKETRSSDTIARVGGDEFVLLLPGNATRTELSRVGKRIIERLERPIPYGDELCRISASIGTVQVAKGTDTTPEAALDDADVALYASKRAGRAQQTFYSPEMRKSANNIEPPQKTASIDHADQR